MLSRSIILLREARPALLASVDFVEPSPAEKADQDALNIEVAALAEKRTR